MIRTVNFDIALSAGKGIAIQDCINLYPNFEPCKIFDDNEFNNLRTSYYIYILNDNNIYEPIEAFDETIIDYYLLKEPRIQTVLNEKQFNDLKNKVGSLYVKKNFTPITTLQGNSGPYFLEPFPNDKAKKTVSTIMEFEELKLNSFRIFIKNNDIIDSSDNNIEKVVVKTPEYSAVEEIYYYIDTDKAEEKRVTITSKEEFEAFDKPLYFKTGYQRTHSFLGAETYYYTELESQESLNDYFFQLYLIAYSGVYIEETVENVENGLTFYTYDKIEQYQENISDYWYIDLSYIDSDFIQGTFIQYIEANLNVSEDIATSEEDDKLENYLNYPISINFDDEEDNIILQIETDNDDSVTENDDFVKELVEDTIQNVDTWDFFSKSYFDINGNFQWDGIEQDRVSDISSIKFFIPEEDELKYQLKGYFTYADDLDDIEEKNENIIITDIEPF